MEEQNMTAKKEVDEGMAGENMADKKAIEVSMEETNTTVEGKDTVNTVVSDATQTDNTEEKAEEKTQVQDERNAKERFYDTIPVTYKQADFVAKAAIIILVVLLAYLVITSDVWR